MRAAAGGSAEQLLAQMDELTRDLDAESAGQSHYQLADQLATAAAGGRRRPMTFQALAERYPEHSLTPPALLWLLQYYASGEAAWRMQCDDAQRQKRFERAVAIGRQIERTRFG